MFWTAIVVYLRLVPDSSSAQVQSVGSSHSNIRCFVDNAHNHNVQRGHKSKRHTGLPKLKTGVTHVLKLTENATQSAVQ